MEKQIQVKKILELIRQNKPHQFFREINEVDTGIGFVLCYLKEHNGIGYANSIAEEAGVSRTRMMVLINKLEQKGFICKEDSKIDARIDILKLTPLGVDYAQSLINKVEQKMFNIINDVGYDKVLQCVEIINEICNVLKKTKKEGNRND